MDWKHWRYKNTTFLFLSLLVFFVFAESQIVEKLVTHIGNLGYIGAFIAGVFFVSVFTVIPAGAILFFLAENLNPFGLAIMAGLGGVVGDYFIFRFFRDRVFSELKPLFLDSGGNAIVKLFKTPHFVWITPLIGAVIVASPFPDELGLGFLGVSKIKDWQFLLLTFILNTIGIFTIVTIAKAI